MTAILAIDSSCEICSVALNIDGDISAQCSNSVRRHADEILPMICALLPAAKIAIHELDAITLIQGPGSFTGLRIGSAVAQGLAWPHDIPVIPLSSLAVMALAAHREHGLTHMCVAMEAREGEVYWARYTARDMIVTLHGTERVLSVNASGDDVEDGLPWAAVGNAWSSTGALRQRMADIGPCFPDIQPRASIASILGLQAFLTGNTGSATDALPVYLKEQEYR